MEKHFRLICHLHFPNLISGMHNNSRTNKKTIISDQGKPYLGIVYDESDLSNGLKIRQILSGPFEQAVFGNHNINIEHDRLMLINDFQVSAKNFNEIISEFRPGQTVSLIFKNDREELEKLTELEVTLGSDLDWTGPIKKINLIKPYDRRYDYLPDIGSKNYIVNFIDNEAKNVQLDVETNKLYKLFDDWQLSNQSFNTLSRVIFPFKHPDKLIELESFVTLPLAKLN